jgi:hypothetical protein
LRQVVVHGTLDEFDVRPPAAFRGLVEACIGSAKQLLEQAGELAELTICPACGGDRLEAAFSKHGYEYRHCTRCWSLFASPRLLPKQMDWYLRGSPAAEYRRRPSYVEELSLRMDQLSLYQANWVAEIASLAPADKQIVQVEPRGFQLLRQLYQQDVGPLAAAGPLPPSQDPPAELAIDVSSQLADIPAESAAVGAAFDVFEHQCDPAGLLTEMHRLLSPGGFLMLTTRSGSGFDIQTLWEHSDVFPLEHVNLISVEGMHTLLESIGFEVLEISTPGLLDLQIIQRVANQAKDVEIPRFLKYFLANRDMHSADRLQEFLQSQRLSSHMRVLARKSDQPPK